MSRKTFYNYDHAEAYLSGSVIRLGKEPIYISHVDVDAKGKLLLRYSPSAQAVLGLNKVVAIDDEDLNYSPVPLGFLSVKDKSKQALAWASRIPQRRWKVGLTAGNLGVFSPDRAGRYYWDPGAVLISDELRNTILNNYPSYEEAKSLSEKHKGMLFAFSRRFAVGKEKLYYKNVGSPVGEAAAVPVLHDDKAFLSEVLKEDLNG